MYIYVKNNHMNVPIDNLKEGLMVKLQIKYKIIVVDKYQLSNNNLIY